VLYYWVLEDVRADSEALCCWLAAIAGAWGKQNRSGLVIITDWLIGSLVTKR
jgi:hypothetical protein